MTISESQLKALVGRSFPGGRYTIAHWENFLLSEATGSDPLPEGLAHPAHLFHVPIQGVGTSIAELFELGRAASDASVTIDYYDWEFMRPLREEREYQFQGGITEHERKEVAGGTIVDSLTFRIEMCEVASQTVDVSDPAARATFRWHFWRFAS